MEIEQFLYDFTESGEAIIAYKLSTPTGVVELCNLGASILSYTVDGGNILSGQCYRSLSDAASVSANSKPLNERLWDSRVEVNRVVFSTEETIDEVAVQIEVVFDYDDENTLEITYLAYADGDVAFDLTHLFTLDMGGEASFEKIDCGDPIKANIREQRGEYLLLSGAERNILNWACSLAGRDSGCDLYTSHPAIYFSIVDAELATITYPTAILPANTRFVQKSVIKV